MMRGCRCASGYIRLCFPRAMVIPRAMTAARCVRGIIIILYWWLCLRGVLWPWKSPPKRRSHTITVIFLSRRPISNLHSMRRARAFARLVSNTKNTTHSTILASIRDRLPPQSIARNAFTICMYCARNHSCATRIFERARDRQAPMTFGRLRPWCAVSRAGSRCAFITPNERWGWWIFCYVCARCC